MLALGDLSYADERSQADVDRHFDDVMVWSRRAAYMPVWGNHEWERQGRRPAQLQGPLRAAPRGCIAGRARGRLLRRGLVLVRPGRRPLHHLPGAVREGDLARLGAAGGAAVRRRAGRSGAALHRDGGPPARVQLRRTRRQGAAPRDPRRLWQSASASTSSTCAAHSHNYERTKPQGHVVHVTAGIGGGALEHAPTACKWPTARRPPGSAFRAIHHGFVKLTVRDEGIALEAICAGASPGRGQRPLRRRRDPRPGADRRGKLTARASAATAATAARSRSTAATATDAPISQQPVRDRPARGDVRRNRR